MIRIPLDDGERAQARLAAGKRRASSPRTPAKWGFVFHWHVHLSREQYRGVGGGSAVIARILRQTHTTRRDATLTTSPLTAAAAAAAAAAAPRFAPIGTVSWPV